MFSEFFARLRGSAGAEPLPPLDARLAIGALLVRIAKADAHYAYEEIAKIDILLAEAEDLPPVEAAKLRATCEKLEAEAPDTETFTAMIQERVGYEERAAVHAALWDVGLADKVLRKEEEAFLAEAAKALGITAADAQAAGKGRKA